MSLANNQIRDFAKCLGRGKMSNILTQIEIPTPLLTLGEMVIFVHRKELF